MKFMIEMLMISFQNNLGFGVGDAVRPVPAVRQPILHFFLAFINLQLLQLTSFVFHMLHRQIRSLFSIHQQVDFKHVGLAHRFQEHRRSKTTLVILLCVMRHRGIGPVITVDVRGRDKKRWVMATGRRHHHMAAQDTLTTR